MNKYLLAIGLLTLGGFITFFVVLSLSQPKTNLQTNLKLVSVFPKNGSLDVPSSPNIAITFSRALTDNEKKTVSTNISPQINNVVFWESDDATAKIILEKPFSFETNYTITINYGLQVFSWRFTTKKTTSIPVVIAPTPIASTSAEDVLANQQLQDDSVFAKGQLDFLSKYPWYNELPPVNDEYFVDFDPTKNLFIIELYPQASTSASINDQLVQFKNNALLELQSIGVNAPSYNVEWIIVPR
jgi:hypothetical protein